MSVNYPRQLLSDMIGCMDERILKFREDYKLIYVFIQKPLMDVMDEVIEISLMKKKISVTDILRDEKKKRNRQKKRWLLNAEAACKDMNYEDLNHPFHKIITNYKTSNSEQRELLYSRLSIDDVVKRELEKTSSWADDSETYLTQFPAIASLTMNKVEKAYKSDLAMFIGEYIKDKYQGDPNKFYIAFPNMPPEMPIFGPHKIKLQVLEESNNTLVEYFNLDEDSIFKTIITKKNKDIEVKKIESLDTVDYEILAAALSKGIGSDFYMNGTLRFPLGMAAKVMGGSKPSKFHYDQASERIKNWPNAQYEIINKKDAQLGGRLNLFDHTIIDIEENGIKKNVTVSCGTILKECIIRQQITMINANDYQSLNNSLTKLVSILLQEERIKQAAMNPLENEDKTFEFDCNYKYFSHKIRFKETSWRKNLEDLMFSFGELKKNKLIVKDYSCKNNDIFLSLFKLTENEKQDIKFEKV